MYATIGDQCLIKIKTWSEYIIPYKTEVATDVTDVTDFDNEQKCYCILTQATIKFLSISKRQKSDIIIIHIMRQPKPVS